MLATVFTALAIGLGIWAALLAGKYLLPQARAALQTRRDRVREAEDRIRADGGMDYTRAWLAQTQPAREKAHHTTAVAQTGLKGAEARETQVLTSFKDGKEPSHRFKVFAIAMLVVWILAVIAAFLVDRPIIASLNAGNGWLGIVGTVLLLCVPAVGSLWIGELIAKGRERTMHFAWVSLAVIGILVVVGSVVWGLTNFAKVRAQVEYADEIAKAQQRVAAMQIDGDPNLIAFAQQGLRDVQDQEERSEEWNTIQVPVASAVEFASGLLVPSAFAILFLNDARGARRKAAAAVQTAERQEQALLTQQQAELSATMRRLGIEQLGMRQNLQTATAENAAPAPRIELAAPERSPVAPAPVTPAPQTPADQAITAEIVPTTEVEPILARTAAPRPPRPSQGEPRTPFWAPRSDETPASQPPAAAADDNAPDPTFNLN